MDKNKLYTSLFQSYVEAHPNKTRQVCQNHITEIWNGIKKDADLPQKVESLLNQYKSLALKNKGALCKFWGTLPKKSEASGFEKTISQIPIEFSPDSDQFKEPISSGDEKDAPVPSDSSSSAATRAKNVVKAKVQDEIKKQIGLINADLVGLYKRRSCGQLTGDQEVELKKKKKEKDQLEDLLKKKIDAQQRQQKFRNERKKNLLNCVKLIKRYQRR